MATVTITPASGSITSTVTACKVTVASATQNDDTAYNSALYPASPEVRYYLTFEEGAVEKGRSYVFGVDEDGGHVFNNYIFPDAGTWVVHLRLAADDSSVADTGNITVA